MSSIRWTRLVQRRLYASAPSRLVGAPPLTQVSSVRRTRTSI